MNILRFKELVAWKWKRKKKLHICRIWRWRQHLNVNVINLKNEINIFGGTKELDATL